jgi:hypothetical protein
MCLIRPVLVSCKQWAQCPYVDGYTVDLLSGCLSQHVIVEHHVHSVDARYILLMMDGTRCPLSIKLQILRELLWTLLLLICSTITVIAVQYQSDYERESVY